MSDTLKKELSDFAGNLALLTLKVVVVVSVLKYFNLVALIGVKV